MDPVKGRCLESLATFATGTIIWTEPAFLVSCGTDETNESILLECEGNEDLMNALEEQPQVQTEDTARNLIKLAALVTRAGFSSHPYRELFEQLHPSNLNDCVASIASFRALESRADCVLSGLSDVEAGRLLGILNNNQVEVELGGANGGTTGSGLFVFTAITEHSCAPNCSFTTKDDMLYMCAIQDIAPGDRISIDYINGWFRSTSERQTELSATYGFTCVCPSCTTASDNTRSFWCSKKNCPGVTFMPNLDSSEWSACSECNTIPPKPTTSTWMRLEAKLAEKEGLTVEQIQKFRSARSGLHEAHSVYFWALYDIAMDISQSSDCDDVAVAVAIFEELTRVLETYHVTPAVHHENVIFWDRRGQFEARSGDFESARASYARAYQESVMACGSEAPMTVALKGFAPTSMKDILAHYS